MKGTESAKNTFEYWWTFFLYATTNIHIAAYFFVYNKLLPWSPNPKRQIFLQMTFFLFFTYFQSWEFAYSSLSTLGVKRMNWNKNSGITMHDFEYFGTQAHLLHQMLSQELFCSYNDKNKSEITHQKIPLEFHIHLVHPILHL